MYVVSYYKLGHKWYLDLPEYLETGDADDLERAGSFHDFLEIVSDGKDSVSFQMDFAPFEGADEMVLTGSSGDDSGGYYYVNKIGEQLVDLEIWVNNTVYYNNQSLHPVVYLKKL